MTDERRRALDAFDEHEGRVRLYRDEFEDMIQFYAAVNTIASCLKKMERLAKLNPGTWTKVQSGYTRLKNALVEMSTKVSVHQYKMITTNKGSIVFRPTPESGKYAMGEDEYYRLMVAARIGACAHCLSCMTRSEWQKCELMKTLDTVPCREGIHERQQLDQGVCPFAIMDPDEFTKTAEAMELR